MFLKIIFNSLLAMQAKTFITDGSLKTLMRGCILKISLTAAMDFRLLVQEPSKFSKNALTSRLIASDSLMLERSLWAAQSVSFKGSATRATKVLKYIVT